MRHVCIAVLVEGVLAAVLSSSLAGCGGKASPDESVPSADNAPPPGPTGTGDPTGGAPPVPTGQINPTPPAADFPEPEVRETTVPLPGQCTTTVAGAAIVDLPLPAGVDAVLEYVYEVFDRSGTPKLVAMAGQVCAKATDVAKCESAVTALAPPNGPAHTNLGCSGGGCQPTAFLVTTAGDTVTKIEHGKDVIALYGQVSSTAEAAVVEQLDSAASLTCHSFTPQNGGFEFAGCGTLRLMPDGTIVNVSGTYCAGRLPEGCVLSRPDHGDDEGIGAWLATIAELEAAAVSAFERMALELRHHGAPAELVERAEEAREDEIRHAAMMRLQAARFGGKASRPCPSPMHVRDLEAIARENAVEGCARETMGAIVGAYQARTAADEQLRADMERIAADEARHAQLSWDLAAWIEPRLDGEARARVEEARRTALEALGAALVREAEAQADVPGLALTTGLPGAAAAEALFDAALVALVA